MWWMNEWMNMQYFLLQLFTQQPCEVGWVERAEVAQSPPESFQSWGGLQSAPTPNPASVYDRYWIILDYSFILSSCDPHKFKTWKNWCQNCAWENQSASVCRQLPPFLCHTPSCTQTDIVNMNFVRCMCYLTFWMNAVLKACTLLLKKFQGKIK